MAEWDEKSGKLRPVWTVSFSPWWVFIGCGIAGIITAAMVFVTFIVGSDSEELNASGALAQGGMLLLGLTVAAYLVVGPTLAWGVGFAIRHIDNHWIHIITFGALGLIVGFMYGEILAPGLGNVVAPASGLGAALARWIINPQARI